MVYSERNKIKSKDKNKTSGYGTVGFTENGSG